jgi:hypothetical protein
MRLAEIIKNRSAQSRTIMDRGNWKESPMKRKTTATAMEAILTDLNI